MKFSHTLSRAKFVGVTLCSGTSLGMPFLVWRSAPFIGLMLGAITVGIFIMLVSGKWSAKKHITDEPPLQPIGESFTDQLS